MPPLLTSPTTTTTPFFGTGKSTRKACRRRALRLPVLSSRQHQYRPSPPSSSSKIPSLCSTDGLSSRTHISRPSSRPFDSRTHPRQPYACYLHCCGNYLANFVLFLSQMQVAFMDSRLAPPGQGVTVDSPVSSLASHSPTQADSFRTPKIVFNPDPSNRISLATLHRCVQVRILIASFPSIQNPSCLVCRTSHHPRLHPHHAQIHHIPRVKSRPESDPMLIVI